MTQTVLHGDCLAIMPTLAADSFDACVCDPPYHLTAGKASAPKGFMGKVWDGGDVAFRPETWAEVFRVLKPGGYLVAFGGPRNSHRMVCAIEDAGFEIRDSISYLYDGGLSGPLLWAFGSGFPKSHDVSKGIDKAAGAVREVVGTKLGLPGMAKDGSNQSFDSAFGGKTGRVLPSDITAPATPEAAAWQGWGTALKPAHEPICLARKPLSERTVAANVLRHGTGAINVDGCRVGMGDTEDVERLQARSGGERGFSSDAYVGGKSGRSLPPGWDASKGRWPANLIHDGSEEVLEAFAKFGVSSSGTGAIKKATAAGHQANAYGKESRPAGTPMICHGDTGSVARFFYSSKADAADRLGSRHPTIKPVDLMRYLCRLITPPGGHILDPFAGSGTTGMAAMAEGFRATLIEREAEYHADILRRLAHVSGADAPLFAAAD